MTLLGSNTSAKSTLATFGSPGRLIPISRDTVARWRALVDEGRACQKCDARAAPLLKLLGA